MTDSIKFIELKSQIKEAIEAKLKISPIANESGFALLDGFIMEPISTEVSGSVVIGGPRIPLVGIVGGTSGRLYLFALKALLPGLSL